MVSLEKLDKFFDKFPWLLPAIGFIGGCSSLFLVQRGSELAKITAGMVIIGWVWVLTLPVISRIVRRFTNKRLSNLMSTFVSQSIQQEILFFSLPFLLISTSSQDAGQLLFSALVIFAAFVSCVDPIYERYIATNRFTRIGFHCACSFIAGLVVLPIVVQIPMEKSFYVSMVFIFAWLFIAVPALYIANLSTKEKSIKVFLVLCVPVVLVFSRSHIPPAGIYVSKARITSSVDNHEPAAILTALHIGDLERGLYAYSVISSPRGVEQRIIFNWKHEGYSEQIISEITGGRSEGYRTFSYKENFIDNAEGKWTVDITTAQGQLLERLTFYVYS